MNILEEIQNCPVEWKELGEVTDTVTSPVKLTKKEYQVSGKIPIVDQGEQFIAGFSDYGKYLKKDEYIIFGDHSEHVKYIDFAFVQGADGLKILKPKSGIKAKYIYYCFCNFYKKEGSYKRHWSKARTTLIPIPQSEEIQEKIVQTLDKFTDYVTELTSELTSRNKQYSYYRDKLLSFEDEVYPVEWKELGEVVKYTRGKGLSKKDKETGNFPIILYGELYTVYGNYIKRIVSFSSEDVKDKSVRIRAGDIVLPISSTTKEAQIGKGSVLCVDEVFLGGDAISLSPLDFVLSSYLMYVINGGNFEKEKMNCVRGTTIQHLNPDSLLKIKIPIPPLEIQEKIVQILDNFDTVCNDLNIGLPKEIELRQKQYEYWRNQLLNFSK